jgi:hypothetical protein
VQKVEATRDGDVVDVVKFAAPPTGMQPYVTSVCRNPWCPIAQLQPLNPHHHQDPLSRSSDSPAGVYLCFSLFLATLQVYHSGPVSPR